jgi:glycosyltransferase involved in cell wall biosynthesis
MSVLHVVASINVKTGGPALSVAGLATALVRNGLQARIATHDYPEHGRQVDAPGVRVVSVPVGTIARRMRGYSPALEGAVVAAADGIDIVHSHGLWMAPNIYARRTATRLRLPLVISPRGMLDAWALERSPIRKGLASRAYERRNLQAARLLHATSEMEASAIRQYGATQPIAVLPNGIEVPNRNDSLSRHTLESRFPELRGRRWLLFMGRIHAKKGLDLLLDAWGRLHHAIAGWHLVIAGPDLDGSRPVLEKRIAGDAQADSITLTGMLEGAEKEAALENADLFVLPTRSENFGIAVAEALAHGTPVVTTTAAPWSDLVTHRCGWWVPPEAPAIEGALRSAMILQPGDLAAMGQRGRRIAIEKYGLDPIARQMARVYEWIAHGGAAPDCIRQS